jgi:hypothetical protein
MPVEDLVKDSIEQARLNFEKSGFKQMRNIRKSPELSYQKINLITSIHGRFADGIYEFTAKLSDDIEHILGKDNLVKNIERQLRIRSETEVEKILYQDFLRSYEILGIPSDVKTNFKFKPKIDILEVQGQNFNETYGKIIRALNALNIGICQ